MNNSIQKIEEGECESPEKTNQGGIPNGNGDEINREENNNGLGELDPSTKAANPTVGAVPAIKSKSLSEESISALRKAKMVISIGLGTPCEKVTHEDECCEEPPITSDTYHAPDTPVKTKGGESTVTPPTEHPKPVNKCGDGCDGTAVKPEKDEEDDSVVKGEEHIPTWEEIRKGAQKRPGANGGVSPSGKKLSPAEERAEADAKSKKAQEKKFEDQKASEFGDVTGNYAHTKQIVDRLKARYGGKTTKGEEHIPTWDEIRKAQTQMQLGADFEGIKAAKESRDNFRNDLQSVRDGIDSLPFDQRPDFQPSEDIRQQWVNNAQSNLDSKLAEGAADPAALKNMRLKLQAMLNRQ